MRPTLFTLFGLGMPSYLFFLILSFVEGSIIANWRAGKENLKRHNINNLVFWIFFSSMAGARLYGALLRLIDANYSHAYFNDLNAFIKLFTYDSGLVANGGILGGTIAFFVYCRIKKINMGAYVNVFALPLSIGIILMRIGCFLAGCCYGSGCSSDLWCFNFPENSPAGQYQLQMHLDGVFPSQLLESFCGLVITVVLLLFRKHFRRNWVEFLVFINMYCFSRFMVDFTRHFPESERIFGLSHNQVLCAIVLSIGVAVLIYHYFYAFRSKFIKFSENDKITISSVSRHIQHPTISFGSGLIVLVSLMWFGNIVQNKLPNSNVVNKPGTLTSRDSLCTLTFSFKYDASLVLLGKETGEFYRVHISNGKARVPKGCYYLKSYSSSVNDSAGYSWRIECDNFKKNKLIDLSNKETEQILIGPPFKYESKLSYRADDTLWRLECSIFDQSRNHYTIKRSKVFKEEILGYVIDSKNAKERITGMFECSCDLVAYNRIRWGEGNRFAIYPSVPKTAPFEYRVDTLDFVMESAKLNTLTINVK